MELLKQNRVEAQIIMVGYGTNYSSYTGIGNNSSDDISLAQVLEGDTNDDFKMLVQTG